MSQSKQINNLKYSYGFLRKNNENQTHKVGDEEADQTLIEGIDHIHPEHIWLVFLSQ